MTQALSTMDFEEAMSPETLKGIAILAGAMAAAPVVYLGLALAVAYNGPIPTDAPDPIFLTMLGLVACATLFFSQWLPSRALKNQNIAKLLETGVTLKDGTRLTTRGQLVGSLLRANVLLRLAMLDAIAVYSLLVAFMAQGLLQAQPLWLLSLLPCPLVSLWIFARFPTKERLREIFEEHLQGRS